MYLRLMLPVLFLAFLSGCASQTFEPVKPSVLSKVIDKKHIELNEDVKMEAMLGLPRTTWIIQLKAGKYYSEFEDEAGTFYRGPEKVIHIYNAKDPQAYPSQIDRGGIWVAKCSNLQAKSKIDIYEYGANIATDQTINQTTNEENPFLTINPPKDVVSGVGAGLGWGIVGAIVDAHNSKILPKNIHILVKDDIEILKRIVFPQLEPCMEL